MAKKATDRYQSAREVADVLAEWLRVGAGLRFGTRREEVPVPKRVKVSCDTSDLRAMGGSSSKNRVYQDSRQAWTKWHCGVVSCSPLPDEKPVTAPTQTSPPARAGGNKVGVTRVCRWGDAGGGGRLAANRAAASRPVATQPVARQQVANQPVPNRAVATQGRVAGTHLPQGSHEQTGGRKGNGKTPPRGRRGLCPHRWRSETRRGEEWRATCSRLDAIQPLAGVIAKWRTQGVRGRADSLHDRQKGPTSSKTAEEQPPVGLVGRRRGCVARHYLAGGRDSALF